MRDLVGPAAIPVRENRLAAQRLEVRDALPRRESARFRHDARGELDVMVKLPVGPVEHRWTTTLAQLPPITPVPRAPRHVLGIVSVRGVITTVVDLRRLMRVEERPPEKHARILLVDVGGEVLGALVDEVLQVHRLAEDEVELAGVVGGDLSDHVIGVGRPRARRDQDHAGRELIVLLDPEPLFARLERG